jgi:hypothetical protein
MVCSAAGIVDIRLVTRAKTSTAIAANRPCRLKIAANEWLSAMKVNAVSRVTPNSATNRPTDKCSTGIRIRHSARAASTATVAPGSAARATITGVRSRDVTTAAGTARVVT